MKNVAVVGSTGAVGREMLKVLQKRNFPVRKLKLLASARSAEAGVTQSFHGVDVAVEELTQTSFRGVDIALFSAGSKISKEFAEKAARSGCVVVDNSSAFRMYDYVPLVIPEINGQAVLEHQGIIANPNCTTAITLMALYPLHKAFRVTRIFASSYQAVSGTGALAIEELERQVREVAASQPVTSQVYPHQIAFNVLPHVDSFLANGHTQEEMKLGNESRKIMNHPDFRVSVTCVRVPVYRAHSVSVTAEFDRSLSLEAAREAWRQAPGLDVLDEPAANLYPTPLLAAGKDNCQVGRLRYDTALHNGLAFWVCGDQLLKGAALNAVQIAELLV